MPASLPSTTAATAAHQVTQNAALGAPADAAASTDTATASQIALQKRLLQRLTALIALLPSALESDRLKVAATGTSDATAANQALEIAALGAPADSAAAGDSSTASLIAHIKRLQAKLPALDGGRLAVAPTDLTGSALSLLTSCSNSLASLAGAPAGTVSSVTPSRVTVAATATLVLAADTDRADCLIRNLGNETAYFGPLTVTSSTGYPVDPGETLNWQHSITLYAITASSTTSLALLELTNA